MCKENAAYGEQRIKRLAAFDAGRFPHFAMSACVKLGVERKRTLQPN